MVLYCAREKIPDRTDKQCAHSYANSNSSEKSVKVARHSKLSKTRFASMFAACVCAYLTLNNFLSLRCMSVFELLPNAFFTPCIRKANKDNTPPPFKTRGYVINFIIILITFKIIMLH